MKKIHRESESETLLKDGDKHILNQNLEDAGGKLLRENKSIPGQQFLVLACGRAKELLGQL